MEEDEIFQQANDSYVYVNPDPDAARERVKLSYADSLVADIEAKFQNMPNIEEERRKEKELLEEKIRTLTKKLKSIKNVKNHRLRAQNAQNSEKRAKLRAQIEEAKQELFNLEMEKQGSEITSTSLVEETVKSNIGTSNWGSSLNALNYVKDSTL